jgi:hypothetical protein
MKKAALSGAAILLSACAAQADCIDEIREIFALKSTQENVRVDIETSMNGEVVQETNGWILDTSHNIYEVVGRDWWSMTAGKVHYNSTDGVTWQKSDMQDPDWEAKARANTDRMLANMTDTRCGETEEIDGRAYQVFGYSYASDKPYPTDTDTVMYFDPEAQVLFRTVSHSKLATGGTVVTTYMPDDAIAFPEMN